MAATPYRTAPPRRLSAPVLPVRNTVLYPGQTLEVAVGRERSLAAVAASVGAGELLVLGQTSEDTDEPDPARGDLAGVGTVGRVVQVIHLGGHSVVTVQGASRVRVLGWRQRDPFLLADAEELASGDDERMGAEEIWRRFAAYALARGLPADPPEAVAGAAGIADAIAMRLWLARDERQRLLETAPCGARLELIDEILARDEARPPDARALVEPARGDLAWSGEVGGATGPALFTAIAALARVSSLLEARRALVFSIPPGGDDDSVREFSAEGRLDARVLRDLIARAIGRRPQSTLARLIWSRSEPVFVPILRIMRARVWLDAPLGTDGRFELDTPDGRVALPVEPSGDGVWAAAPDHPAGEHRWEPVRVEVRVAEDLRIRLWSQWSRWKSDGAPLLLGEVAAGLGRRWRVVDED